MLAPAAMMSARDAKGATAPAAPSNLVSSPASSTSALLTWNDNSVREDEFVIYRRTGSDPYAEVDTVGANVEEYEDTGLTTGQEYDHKVSARNEAGESTKSNQASVTPSDVTDAPTNLQASAASASRVDLTWTDNASNEDNYVVYRDGVQIDTIAANSTSYSATGLTEGTEYDWKVGAKNSSGTAFSSTVTQATKLAQPTGVTKQELVTDGPVRLMWTDESGKEQNYEVFRNSSLIATIAADTEQYDDSDSPDIDATYEIQATHSSLPDSNKVTASRV